MNIKISINTFFELWRMVGRLESLLLMNKLPAEIVEEINLDLRKAWDEAIKVTEV